MKSTYLMDDYLSYADLLNGVNHIRLKTVLQTHFINEKDVNHDCKGTCKDIKSLDLYTDEKCKGYIYYCENVIKRMKTAYKVHSVRVNNKITCSNI